MRYQKQRFVLTILCLLTITLMSYAQSVNSVGSDSNVQITFSVESDPPIMGESEFIVTLKGGDGAPIRNATVNVEGDMSHAGMAPIIRTMDEAEDSTYRAPFEWSMAGDWFVTVTATLEDGQEFEQIFEFSAASGE